MQRTLLATLGSLLVLATSAAARWGFPEPLTDRGAIMEDIYTQIFVAGLIVFLFVMALLVWVIWRYREGSGHGRATYESHRHHTGAEVTWTVVPLMIMLWIGVISYVGLVELDDQTVPEGAEVYDIGIVGSQWNWEASYPNGFSVSSSPDGKTGDVKDENVFLIPADEYVRFNITSSDVIHAWHLSDDNRASVALVDANPGGDHEFNEMLLNLPEGNYTVQCREMCFNPGHAYMRARVNAVPMDEYNLWSDQREAAAGATLVQSLDVNGESMPTELTVVTGTRIIFTYANDANEPVIFTSGSEVAGTVGAQSTGVVAIEFAAPGDHSFSWAVGGAAPNVVSVAAVDAELITVDLGNFELLPGDLNLEAGVTYLITVNNIHDTSHNLFIGDFAAGEVIAESATIGGGASASFVVTLDEPGTIDMWCDIAGHYDLGMYGAVTVEDPFA